MDEQQARDDIRLIKAMIEKTRAATVESGTLLIVWGVLITLALIGSHIEEEIMMFFLLLFLFCFMLRSNPVFPASDNQEGIELIRGFDALYNK